MAARGCLVGVLAASGIGALLGVAAGLALRAADAAGWIEKHSFLSFSIALSLLAVTAAKLAGSDGILASFAAGVCLNLVVDRKKEQAEENVQEAIGKLFNLPVFVLLGAALPWTGWQQLGGRGLAFVVAIFLLRRPPVVCVLVPALRSRLTVADIAFLSWFGPVGISALYYALHALELGHPPLIWHATSLAIAGSVLVHGVTSAPLMTLYERRTGRPSGTAVHARPS